MSTRSGKRLHASFYENSAPMNVESAVKSERKTRSRRLKENVDDISISMFKKKRNNYVSYPTDDEQNGLEVASKCNEGPPARMLRRNTLKEHNIDAPDVEISEPKNLIRKSRRGKKNAFEDASKDENVESVQSEKPKSKKGKRKKTVPFEVEDVPIIVAQVGEEPAVVVEKKSKKKRKAKKSYSISAGNIKDAFNHKNSSFNKSNFSNDSFHSAAGSPRDAPDELEPDSEDVELKDTIPNKQGCFNEDVNEKVVLKRASLGNLNESLKSFNKRKSIQNNTFDKSDPSHHDGTKVIDQDADTESVSSELSEPPKRLSNINNGTFDKSLKIDDTTFEKDDLSERINNISKRKSSINNGTFDKSTKVNTTFEKDNKNSPHDKNDQVLNTTIEKEAITLRKKSTNHNGTFNTNESPYTKDIGIPPGSSKKRKSKDAALGKNDIDKTGLDQAKKGVRRQSVIDTTFDRSNTSINTIENQREILNSAKKRKSLQYDGSFRNYKSLEKASTFDNETNSLKKSLEKASTYHNETNSLIKRKSVRLSRSFAVQDTLNATYDKASESSIISSDNSVIDRSNLSRISITSDDSSENIVNTTPVLVESSLDESRFSGNETLAPLTPLKREGTFTKEGPEVQETDTPSKRKSLPVIPAAGCTPFHVSRSSQKSVLNITRSIEKESSFERAPRTTKVMFCSPIDNPALVVQEKRKVIKSNLKGSNKSFIVEDAAPVSRPAARKRSYTQNDADDTRVKRKRLADDLQQSVNRLSRPRTSSAAAKLTDSTTPSKKPVTPSKSRTEGKQGRTKLPNFAALHQRNFAKMESLDECQQRRAKRAKQLLTPTGAVEMLERISPKGTTTAEPAKPKDDPKKTDTPTKPLTLESLRPGFTRFGFKLNLDVNPFSVPSKDPGPKANPKKPTPSLAGATARREAAKQTVMREKSFTDKRNLVKRNENRTIIRGVRTNRRFELQMKLRNV